MNQNENLIGILSVFYKWRKKIILLCVLAGIISAVLSLTLDNYYQSSTVFYAASPDLAKPSPLGTNDGEKDFYGAEEDLDRLLSIAGSSEVVDYLIDKYDLFAHYEINPESKKGPIKIRERFNKLYKTLKTKFGAIQLSVEDKNPQLASQIANDARDKINSIAQRLIKDSQYQLLKTNESNISNKEEIITILSDSLYRTRELYKIYSTETQGQVYAELLAKTSSSLIDKKARLRVYNNVPGMQDSVKYLGASINGLEDQKKSLTTQVNTFNQGLAKVMNLEFEQKDFAKQLSLDKERYKLLQAAHNTPFVSIHVVEKAEIPIEKSRPGRSIIVLGSIFLTFLFASLIVLFLESYRSLDWDKIKGQ